VDLTCPGSSSFASKWSAMDAAPIYLLLGGPPDWNHHVNIVGGFFLGVLNASKLPDSSRP
jgi:hypothetical protein